MVIVDGDRGSVVRGINGISYQVQVTVLDKIIFVASISPNTYVMKLTIPTQSLVTTQLPRHPQ
jgi:hypothetical protein